MRETLPTSVPADEDTIPLLVPEIRGNEWLYLKECLDTNWVSSAGPFVERFERMVADHVGAKYAVATVNGTAALHVALLVAGVQPDDEVLVSTLTFIAPANAIRYVGAWPVFVDAEPEYWQMDPQKVLDFVSSECLWRRGALYNRTTGRRIKAVVPVHILGHPVDADPILEIAGEYNLAVIEDATESLGARYKDRMVGHLGDVACFSFNGNKIITAGGGGMIVTDDEEWARKAGYLTTQGRDHAVEYIHNEVGFNYRLTNIQAALGCAQMEQLGEYISQKRHIAAAYSETLGKVAGITTMREASWADSIFWMYTALVDEALYGMDSRELLNRLAAEGIQARPLWQPIDQSPAYASLKPAACPIANTLYRDALSLPCSVGLHPRDVERVVGSIFQQGNGNGG